MIFSFETVKKSESKRAENSPVLAQCQRRSFNGTNSLDDFVLAEVWTQGGLVTYYVLFFMHLTTRRVHIAGITPHPNEPWMIQVARNVTMADVGFLSSSRYLIHDRDAKFCESFRDTIEGVGVTLIRLPARSPELRSRSAG